MDHPTATPDTDGRALPWRTFLGVLAAGSLLLVLASYVTLELLDHPFFAVGGMGHAYLNVGVEANVPTWWSGTVLAVGGASLLLLAWLLRTDRRPGVWPTLALAALLLALSLDEMVSIHEQLYRVGRLVVSAETIPFVWLAVGIPLALAVVVVVAVLARGLPRATRPLLLAGLLTFFAGAIGLELVGSQLHPTHGVQAPLTVAIYHGEELLEMLGAALMAVAPLRAVRVTEAHPGVTLSVAQPQPAG